MTDKKNTINKISSVITFGSIGILGSIYIIGTTAVIKQKLKDKSTIKNKFKRKFRTIINGTSIEDEKFNDIIESTKEGIIWPITFSENLLKKSKFI